MTLYVDYDDGYVEIFTFADESDVTPFAHWYSRVGDYNVEVIASNDG